MIGKVQMPKTKQELIQVLSKCDIQSVSVYENESLNQVPSKSDLQRTKATVVILKLRG